MDRCSVVIVGGGASGLFAAHKLVEAGVEGVVLLEAQPELGGRIKTIRVNEEWLELGAQWIHGRGENPLWKFCQKAEIPICKETNRDGEGLFLRDDGKVIPDEIMKETEAFLDFVHDDCNKFAGMDPAEAPESVGHYFEQEFENWLNSKTEPEEVKNWRRQFFRWFIKWEECDAGCDNLYQQSSTSWGEYIDYDHDSSFDNGYGSLLDHLHNFIRSKVSVRLDHAVKRIQRTNERVLVECANGSTFSADHVMVTVSLGVLKAKHVEMFEPALPENKVAAIEALHFGTIDRIKLVFEEPFWDCANPGFMLLWKDPKPFSPDEWYREIVGFDATLKQPNVLMGWISGDAARFMESLSDKEVGDACCKLLSRFTGGPIAKLQRVIVTRWHSNPFIRGAYSYRSPNCDALGLSTADLSSPICDEAGVPRVLFGGEATDRDHYGTVHGALQAGVREAERIIKVL